MKTHQIAELKQYIESADLALQQAKEILAELGGDDASYRLAKNKAKKLAQSETSENSGKIVEGIFNGQNMIGPDGKEYSVPANYASKSKLVEGDVLKLTIQNDGSFLYKQIKPIEREHIQGKLLFDEDHGQYSVIANNGKKYNVITASVTYFKAEIGDQLTILVPKNKACEWAAIENIVKNNISESENVETKVEQKESTELLPDTQELQKEINSEMEKISKNKKPEKEKPIPQKNEDESETKIPIKNFSSSPKKEKEEIKKIINDDKLDINSLSEKDLADL